MWFQKSDGELCHLKHALRIRIEPAPGDVLTASVVADMLGSATYQDVLFTGTEQQCVDVLAAIAPRLASVTPDG